MAGLAKETVIVAFTPVDDTDEQRMLTANDWSNPDYSYTWGRYRAGFIAGYFDNLGFDVEFAIASTSAISSLGLIGNRTHAYFLRSKPLWENHLRAGRKLLWIRP